MYTIAIFLNYLISAYVLVIVLQVALSWLIAFEIINASNEAAKNLGALLKKLTEPAYKPLRKFIPPIGGVDITPLVLIIIVQIIGGIMISLIPHPVIML